MFRQIFKFLLLLSTLFLFSNQLAIAMGGGNHTSPQTRPPANPYLADTYKFPESLDDISKYYYQNACAPTNRMVTLRYERKPEWKSKHEKTLAGLPENSKAKLLRLAKVLPLYNSSTFNSLVNSGDPNAIDNAYRVWIDFEFYPIPEKASAKEKLAIQRKNVVLASQAAELLQKGYAIPEEQLRSIYDKIAKQVLGKSLTEGWTENKFLPELKARNDAKIDPQNYIKQEMPGVLSSRGMIDAFLDGDASCYKPTQPGWVPFKYKVPLARALMEKALGLEAPKLCEEPNKATAELDAAKSKLSQLFKGLFSFRGTPQEKEASEEIAIESRPNPEASTPGSQTTEQQVAAQIQGIKFSAPMLQYLSLRAKEVAIQKGELEKAESEKLREAKKKDATANITPSERHQCLDAERTKLETVLSNEYKRRMADGRLVRAKGAAGQAWDRMKWEDSKWRTAPDFDRWEYNPRENPLDPCLGKKMKLEECNPEILEAYLREAEPHELRAYEKELLHARRALAEQLNKNEKKYSSPLSTVLDGIQLLDETQKANARIGAPACSMEGILGLTPEWMMRRYAEAPDVFSKAMNQRLPLSMHIDKLSLPQLIDLSYVLWHQPPKGEAATASDYAVLQSFAERKIVPKDPHLVKVLQRMEYQTLIERVGAQLKERLQAENLPDYAEHLPLVTDPATCVEKWRTRGKNEFILFENLGIQSFRASQSDLKDPDGRVPESFKMGCSVGTVDWAKLEADIPKTDKSNPLEYTKLDRALHTILKDLNLPTGPEFQDSTKWFEWAANRGSYHVHHQHIPACMAEGILKTTLAHHEANLKNLPRTEPLPEAPYIILDFDQKSLHGQLMSRYTGNRLAQHSKLSNSIATLDGLRGLAKSELQKRESDKTPLESKQDLAARPASELRNLATDVRSKRDLEDVGAALRYPPHLLAYWRYYREALRRAELLDDHDKNKPYLLKAAQDQFGKIETLPEDRLMEEWHWYTRQAVDGGESTGANEIIKETEHIRGGRGGGGKYTVQEPMLKGGGLGRNESWMEEKRPENGGKDPKYAYTISDGRMQNLFSKGVQRMDMHSKAIESEQGIAEEKPDPKSYGGPKKADPFLPYIKRVMEASESDAQELVLTPMAIDTKHFRSDNYREGAYRFLEGKRNLLMDALKKASRGEEALGYHYNPKDTRSKRLQNAIVNAIRSIDIAYATESQWDGRSDKHLPSIFEGAEDGEKKLQQYSQILMVENRLSDESTAPKEKLPNHTLMRDAIREITQADFNTLRKNKPYDISERFKADLAQETIDGFAGRLPAESRIKLAQLSPYVRKMLSAYMLNFKRTDTYNYPNPPSICTPEPIALTKSHPPSMSSKEIRDRILGLNERGLDEPDKRSDRPDPEILREMLYAANPEIIIDRVMRDRKVFHYYLEMLNEQLPQAMFDESSLDRKALFQDLCRFTNLSFKTDGELRQVLEAKLRSLIIDDGQKKSPDTITSIYNYLLNKEAKAPAMKFKNAEAAKMLAFFIQAIDEIGLKDAGPEAVQYMGGPARFEPDVVLARLSREKALLDETKKLAETDKNAQDRLATLNRVEEFLHKEGMALPSLTKIMILTDADKLAEARKKNPKLAQGYSLGVPEGAVTGMTSSQLQVLDRLALHMSGLEGKEASATRKKIQPLLLMPDPQSLLQVGMTIAPEMQMEIMEQAGYRNTVKPLVDSLERSGRIDDEVTKAVMAATEPHLEALSAFHDDKAPTVPFPPRNWFDVTATLAKLPPKPPEGMSKDTHEALMKLKSKALTEMAKPSNYDRVAQLAKAEYERRYANEIRAAAGNQTELQNIYNSYFSSVHEEVERKYRLEAAMKLFDSQLKELAKDKGKESHYPPKDWKDMEALLEGESLTPELELLLDGNKFHGSIGTEGSNDKLHGDRGKVGALAGRYIVEQSIKGELANFIAGGPAPACLKEALKGQNKTEQEIREALLDQSDLSLDPRPRGGGAPSDVKRENIERNHKLFNQRLKLAYGELDTERQQLTARLQIIDSEIQILAKIPEDKLYKEKRQERVKNLSDDRAKVVRKLDENQKAMNDLKAEYEKLTPEFEKALGKDRARYVDDVTQDGFRSLSQWELKYQGLLVTYSEACLHDKLRPNEKQNFDYFRAYNEGQDFSYNKDPRQDSSIDRAAFEEFQDTQSLLVRGRDLALALPIPTQALSLKLAQPAQASAITDIYLKEHSNRAVIRDWLAEAQNRGIDPNLAKNLMGDWLRKGEIHQANLKKDIDAAIKTVENANIMRIYTPEEEKAKKDGKPVKGTAAVTWNGAGWNVESAIALQQLKRDTQAMQALDEIERANPQIKNPARALDLELGDLHEKNGAAKAFQLDKFTAVEATRNSHSENGYSYHLVPVEKTQREMNDQITKVRKLLKELVYQHEAMKHTADAFFPIPMLTGLQESTERAGRLLRYEILPEIEKLRQFGNVQVKGDPQGYQLDGKTANEAADNLLLQMATLQGEHLKTLKDVDDRWRARFREEAVWLSVEIAFAIATWGLSEGVIASSRALRMTARVLKDPIARKLYSAAHIHKIGQGLGAATQWGKGLALDYYYSSYGDEYWKEKIQSGKPGTELWWAIADQDGDGIYDKYQNGGYIPFKVGNPIEEEKGFYKSLAVFGGSGVLDKLKWLNPFLKSEELRHAVNFGSAGAITELAQGNGAEAAAIHFIRGTAFGLSVPKLGKLETETIGSSLLSKGLAFTQKAGPVGPFTANFIYLSALDQGIYAYEDWRQFSKSGDPKMDPTERRIKYWKGALDSFENGAAMNIYFSKGAGKELKMAQAEQKFHDLIKYAGRKGSEFNRLADVEEAWVSSRMREAIQAARGNVNPENLGKMDQMFRNEFKQYLAKMPVEDGNEFIKVVGTPAEQDLREILQLPDTLKGKPLSISEMEDHWVNTKLQKATKERRLSQAQQDKLKIELRDSFKKAIGDLEFQDPSQLFSDLVTNTERVRNPIELESNRKSLNASLEAARSAGIVPKNKEQLLSIWLQDQLKEEAVKRGVTPLTEAERNKLAEDLINRIASAEPPPDVVQRLAKQEAKRQGKRVDQLSSLEITKLMVQESRKVAGIVELTPEEKQKLAKEEAARRKVDKLPDWEIEKLASEEAFRRAVAKVPKARLAKMAEAEAINRAKAKLTEGDIKDVTDRVSKNLDELMGQVRMNPESAIFSTLASAETLSKENEEYLGTVFRIPTRYVGEFMNKAKGQIFSRNFTGMHEYAEKFRAEAARRVGSEFEKEFKSDDPAKKAAAKKKLTEDAERIGVAALEHVNLDNLVKSLNFKDITDRDLLLFVSHRLGLSIGKIDGSVPPLEQRQFVQFSRFYRSATPLDPKQLEVVFTGIRNEPLPPRMLMSALANGALTPGEAAHLFGNDKTDQAVRYLQQDPGYEFPAASLIKAQTHETARKDSQQMASFVNEAIKKAEKDSNAKQKVARARTLLNEILRKRPDSLYQLPAETLEVAPDWADRIIPLLASQSGVSEKDILAAFATRVPGSASETLLDVALSARPYKGSIAPPKRTQTPGFRDAP